MQLYEIWRLLEATAITPQRHGVQHLHRVPNARVLGLGPVHANFRPPNWCEQALIQDGCALLLPIATGWPIHGGDQVLPTGTWCIVERWLRHLANPWHGSAGSSESVRYRTDGDVVFGDIPPCAHRLNNRHACANTDQRVELDDPVFGMNVTSLLHSV